MADQKKPKGSATVAVEKYPDARRSDHTDVYHGVTVADPYRWLEDPDSAETTAWVKAQGELTDAYFAEHCGVREKLKTRLTKAYDYAKFSCSYRKGDLFYFSKKDGLQNQAVMYQQTALDADPKVFLDPNTLSDDGTAAFKTKAFSDDGSMFAYGISRSGSDWQTIYVMNAVTGEKLSDKVEWSKFSGISWTHDNKGFFYCRYAPPETLQGDEAEADDTKRGAETDKAENQEVWYHRLGEDQSKDDLVYRTPDQPTWMFGAEVSDDGDTLLISVTEGCMPVNRLYVVSGLKAMTSFANLSPIKIVDNFDASYDYLTNEGSKMWFKTNLDAPKYRIITIDMQDPAPDKWVEVVPEKDDVLNSTMCVNGDKLVLIYMVHVKETMTVIGLDGKDCEGGGEIPLPTLGSVIQMTGDKKHAEMFFMFSSFTYPNTSFRYHIPTRTCTKARQEEVPGLQPDQFETRQEFYTSKDGTRVPMFITCRKGLTKTGDAPVFLYAYGGFSISLTPYFSVFRTVFMTSFNAVLVIANIRGGAEYGEDWHTAAINEKRQVCYDDFCGAAEYLIAEKYTNPSKIVINGGSNGGLLVSVCANQRPDLFRCVVSQVPVTDMLRFQKFTIGHAWTTDFGCSDNETHFKAQIKYSPLHNVKPGSQLPAVLVTTADHDDRVVPLHSFKYVATLQHVMGATNALPLLARIEMKAGHGAGKPTSKIIDEFADIYAFIAHCLELTYAE